MNFIILKGSNPACEYELLRKSLKINKFDKRHNAAVEISVGVRTIGRLSSISHCIISLPMYLIEKIFLAKPIFNFAFIRINMSQAVTFKSSFFFSFVLA
jgi:hypothetical protein